MTDQNYSGEILASSLIGFLERKDVEVTRGGIAVRLHPRALEYLAFRLQTLQELDRLRQSSPVEFLRGAFADVDDYTQLQKLQQLLASAKRVCIASTVHHLRDPTRVNLTPFKSLTHLELRNCDLSTSAWLGFSNVNRSLQSLACIGCLEELRHLLAPYSSAYVITGKASSPGNDPSLPWPHLTQLICKQNSLVEMDHTLSLPSLRKLDLSSNNINNIQNLQDCTNLTELNLSHNNIESLLPLHEGPACLRKLVLQGNGVKSMRGISRLEFLSELDLRCNLLASYHEFRELQGLHGLSVLWLEGNPLAYAPFYRLDVLSWVSTPLLNLDGVTTHKDEQEAAGLRVAGEMPLAWQIMSDFVGQGELLWRPPQRDRPAQVSSRPPTWRAGSARTSPSYIPSPSRHGPLSARRSVPSRRIVDFSGDPLAALEESLEQPASPSPFHPREELLETLSESSTASALPSRNSGWVRGGVQTIYRARTEPEGLPKPISQATLRSFRTLPSLVKDSSASSQGEDVREGRDDDGTSDSSSLYSATSSLHGSGGCDRTESKVLQEILLLGKGDNNLRHA